MSRTRAQHQQKLWGGIFRDTEVSLAEHREVSVGFEVLAAVLTSFRASFLLGLFFHTEDGGDNFLRKFR
jgi:hypothetical protein